jgi:hypothetical protein
LIGTEQIAACLAAALSPESAREVRRDRRRLTELTERFGGATRTGARRPEEAFARVLVAYARGDRAAQAWLTDRLRHAARRLTPRRTPPRRGARAVAWRALIIAAGRLHESGVRRLPTRAFLNRADLDALVREGHRQRPASRVRRTQYAPPGPTLRRLAVDRRLQRAASRALSVRVDPAYTAVYMYDPPRSHVPPHLDSEDFGIVVHVVLEHERPSRGGSALIVHRPRKDVRMALAPGQAVVLAGRGAVHQWEPLGRDESRMLVAIGFKRAG